MSSTQQLTRTFYLCPPNSGCETSLGPKHAGIALTPQGHVLLCLSHSYSSSGCLCGNHAAVQVLDILLWFWPSTWFKSSVNYMCGYVMYKVKGARLKEVNQLYARPCHLRTYCVKHANVNVATWP